MQCYICLFTCQVTKESFIEGGFFKTGDAAKVDEDGYYVILGRKNHLLFCHIFGLNQHIHIVHKIYALQSGTNADIMKVGGYKLSALEIEAILLEVSS